METRHSSARAHALLCPSGSGARLTGSAVLRGRGTQGLRDSTPRGGGWVWGKGPQPFLVPRVWGPRDPLPAASLLGGCLRDTELSPHSV